MSSIIESENCPACLERGIISYLEVDTDEADTLIYYCPTCGKSFSQGELDEIYGLK